jgi:hypothetical protein
LVHDDLVAYKHGGTYPEGTAVAGYQRFHQSGIVGTIFSFLLLFFSLELACAVCPSSGLKFISCGRYINIAG